MVQQDLGREMNVKTVLPAVGALTATIGAVDASLGAGGVDWLVEICLSDPDAPMPSIDLPMKHSTHAMPFWAAAAAFASVSFGAMWHQTQKSDEFAGDLSDEEFRLLAALAVVANEAPNPQARDIQTAFNKWSGTPLATEDVDLALAVFDLGPGDADLQIFAEVSNSMERGNLVCAMIQFASSWRPDPKRTLAIRSVADAMNMSAAELKEHWDWHDSGMRPVNGVRPDLRKADWREAGVQRAIRTAFASLDSFSGPASAPVTVRGQH